MALRLVTPSTQARIETPAARLAAARASMTHSAITARSLLSSKDFAGWRRHFAQTAAIGDEHERYIMRVTLAQDVLAVAGLTPHELAQAYLAAAAELVAVLEDEPREPTFLNGAGVLCYELGATKAAEALFKATLRLDPAHPDTKANLRAAKRRRKRGGGPAAMLPPSVLRELRTLGPRAEKVAARARPQSGMTLSLCMIVKDEEEMLPRCLNAVAAYVDELIVVDTGSTDRTVEIAESFGAKILLHEWTGDFAAARNAGWDAATCDWKLFLDADEVLADGEGPRLRELLGHSWREAISLVETNFTGDTDSGLSVDHNAMRLFRNRPEYRFKDRIHEQIAYALPGIPERFETSTVRIEHYGYLGVVREQKDKSTRNLELLRGQLADGHETPFVHFNLGSEYLALDDHDQALTHFTKAWDALATDPDRLGYPYFPSLANRYVRSLRHCGRHEQALAAGDEALALLPGFSDIAFEQASSCLEQRQYEQAEQRFHAVLELGDAPTRYSGSRGTGSFLTRRQLGVLYAAQERWQQAAEQFRTALHEHPGFLAAAQPLVEVELASGAEPKAILAGLQTLVGELSPSALFLVAVPFYERGHVEVAERLLRRSLAARPTADRARLALAETLLSRSRFAAALDEVLTIDTTTPIGLLASRSGLFATLAGPQAAMRFSEARAYAVEAGLPAPELALVDAWQRSDRPPPASIPAEAAVLATVMLQALARIEAFDQFERLAIALDGLDLPWRERRELLAEVFLVRGFLESAADTWIAVIEQQGPDRRALIGLATVAERRELLGDAALLREEAEKLAA